MKISWLNQSGGKIPPQKRAAPHFHVDAVEKPLFEQTWTQKMRGLTAHFLFFVPPPSVGLLILADTNALPSDLLLTAHTRDAPVSRCCVPGSRVSTAHPPSFAL